MPRASLGLENDPKVQQIFTFAQKPDSGRSSESALRGEVRPSDGPADPGLLRPEHEEVSGGHSAAHHHSHAAGDCREAEADQEAQKALAEKIRQRWVAGEDPTKLEKEAMDSSGVKTTPPDVNVGARRPGSLPEAHEAVFDLKAGEISPVYSDPAASLHLQSGLGSPGAA